MHGDYVVTISGTGEVKPVHIVLPVDETGSLLYEQIYVLIPMGVVLPDRYTIILEEALQALEVAVKFLVEGQKPDKYRGLGDWIPRPLDK